jgi:hypothetical protein
MNYSNVGAPLDVANAVILPIAGLSSLSHDLNLRAVASGVHVVGDVTGYFTRVPLEDLQAATKSFVRSVSSTTLVDLSAGSCAELVSCTVDAPVGGTVIVDATAHPEISHTSGTLDRFVLQIETGQVASCPESEGVDTSVHELPASLGSAAEVRSTVVHRRLFPQAAGSTTYRVSGRMTSGANSLDQVAGARAICTFIPD